MIGKRYTKIALMLLLVFALFFGGFQALPAAAAAAQIGTGSLLVEGSQETGALLSETPIQYIQDETAFDALVNTVGAKNVDAADTSIGKSINGIMGLSSKDTYYWAFYVNGIAAPVGSSSYNVHDGDKLSFRYVDWTKPSDSVSLKVIGNNGQSLYDSSPYNIGIADHPTALQLLQVTLGSDKIGLQDTQYGPMIISIDGTSAQGNSYWAFYVNGQYASVGADSYKLQPNDKITFKLETYTPTGDNSNSSGDSNSNGGSNNNNSASSSESLSSVKLQQAIDSASEYTLKNWSDDNIWGAIALKQTGKIIPSSFLSSAIQVVQKNSGKFHYITDAEKYTLGILAAGGDPTNISGYNLVQNIYNGDVTKQGTNGEVYALISLGSTDFPIPSSATWTKEKLINQLLNTQQQDGHWSLNTTDSSSDIDITAMVLAALAPYKDQTEVKDHISKALEYLSSQYLASKVDNSSTAAQIVLALSSLGIDGNGSTFIKDNVSIMQYLMSFQQNDGGFGYKAGNTSDTFSTPQAFEALAAYQMYKGAKGYLYHLPISPNGIEQAPPIQTKQSQVVGNKGNALPNTATNAENMVLAGLLLILAGTILVYFQRKRRA
jgi:LPXTG-motif cell wall-anchored protein